MPDERPGSGSWDHTLETTSRDGTKGAASSQTVDGGPQPLSPPWLEQRRNPSICPSACLEGMEVFTNGREWNFLHINARRYFLFFFSSRAVELDLTNREEVLVVAHYGKLKPLSLHNFPISKGREGSN